jgi:hypothetical protein
MPLDQSQAPDQPFMRPNSLSPQQQQQSQQQQNPLGGLVQPGPQQAPQNISRQQVQAGLHHFAAFKREFVPLLKLEWCSDQNGNAWLDRSLFGARLQILSHRS